MQANTRTSCDKCKTFCA